MINIKDIGISGINLFHIFDRLAVLNLIIPMKYTSFSSRCVSTNIIYTQILQCTTILSAG